MSLYPPPPSFIYHTSTSLCPSTLPHSPNFYLVKFNACEVAILIKNATEEKMFLPSWMNFIKLVSMISDGKKKHQHSLPFILLEKKQFFLYTFLFAEVFLRVFFLLIFVLFIMLLPYCSRVIVWLIFECVFFSLETFLDLFYRMMIMYVLSRASNLVNLYG